MIVFRDPQFKNYKVARRTGKSQKPTKQPRSQRGSGLVKGKKGIPKGVGNTDFFRALTDPFAPTSLGCQVPDPFPFPTQTYHVHQTIVFGCQTGVTSGAVAFLPNPLLSTLDLTRINTGSVLTASIISTPQTPIVVSATLPGGGMYSATSQPSLNAAFSSYRVVSWGIKISNLQPQLSATGRLIMAYFPVSDTTPTLGDIAIATLPGIVSPIMGTPPSVLASSVILEAPTGMELTVGDLLKGDLQMSGLYTNLNFFAFKNTLLSGQPALGFNIGDDLAINGGGGVASVQYKDATRMTGGAGIVLYYEGIPAGTQNAFQVEVIYHLEGTPNFASANNNAIVPSTGRKANVGPTNAVEASIAAAGHIKNLVTFVKSGFEFLNDNKDSIMSFGSAAMAML